MKPDARMFSPWIRILLASALIALLAGGVWFYHVQEQMMVRKVADDLDAIARLKSAQIAAWRKDQLEDAAHLQMHPFLVDNVVHFLAEPQGQPRENLLIRFHSLADQHEYEDILLVDPEGKLLLSLSGKADDYREGYAAAMNEALRLGKPVFTDLHAGHANGPPHIAVVAPLYNGADLSQKPMAALVLAYDTSEFLYPLIRFWPTRSQTAETLLVRQEGQNVLFLNEVRHQPETALNLSIPLHRKDVPAVMAVTGKEGFARGTDYRGIAVASVLLPIPESPWFIIAKIDETEAFAESRFRSILLLALLAGLTLCIVTAGLLLWQRDRKVQYRALYLSEADLRAAIERHSITLKSIGDAVIATDNRGMVELVNPMAEELTGWSDAEARGKPLETIFRIINEETRKKVKNPATRVLREGIVVGLANHTILIAKDGGEKPIADSAAPIHDETGKITGVVLVFRDQTDERAAAKALRESEERYRTTLEKMFESRKREHFLADIIENAEQPLAVGYPDGKLGICNRAFCDLTGYGADELREVNWIDALTPPEWREIEANALAEMDTFSKPARYEKEYLRKDGTRVPVELLVHAVRRADHAIEYYYAFVTDISRRKKLEAEREKLQAQLLQSQRMESVGRLAGGVAHDYNNMLSVILGHTELAMEELSPDHPVHADLTEIFAAANRSKDITRQLLAFARKQTIAPEVLDLNETVESMLKMLRRLIGEDIELLWRLKSGALPVKIDPSQLDQVLANLCVNARDAISDVGAISIETGAVTVDAAYCEEHAEFVPGDFVVLSVSDDGCGMDQETMDNLFEPFFTTKDVGQGTGLGMPTVYGIVRQNNGFINVYSEPGQGTNVRIYLPRHPGDVAGERKQAGIETPRGRGETLLVVEDEPSILKLTERILTDLGYRVITATNPLEALEMPETRAGGIDLLITDVVMPEMNGRDLSLEIKSIYPNIKCLYMSGYTADVIANRGVLDQGFNFIQKPFSNHDIGVKVRAVLDKTSGC